MLSRSRRRCAPSARRGAAVGAIAMLIAGLGAVSAGARAAEPKTGGTLIMGLETDLRGFEPLTARILGNSGATIMNTIEEGLFAFDEKGESVPRLALSAISEQGGKSWLVKLRKGVRFHDGTPFDADAVVQHYNRLLDPKSRFIGLMFVRPIAGAEKVDDHTVRFRMRHPWPLMPGVLTALVGFLNYIPSPKAIEQGTQNRHPVGTGPFRFKEWRSGDRIVVERNPDYWDQGKAHLDKISFRILPDQQTRLASLQAGDIHLMWMDKGTTIRAAMKDPSLVGRKLEGSGAIAIFLLNNSYPPLDDARVRQALAHAWDQAVVVKSLWRDTVPVISHPYGKDLACGDAGYRKHDLAKAKALIADYGQPVEINMIHTTTPRGRQMGQVMQQLFKRAGVKLKLIPVDQVQLIQNVFLDAYQISGWRMADFDDQGPQMFALLHSKSPYNITHYVDPKADKLVETQRLTFDAKKRAGLLCQIAAKINEDAMILYAGGRTHYVFSRPMVKGIPPIKAGIARLGGAWLDE